SCPTQRPPKQRRHYNREVEGRRSPEKQRYVAWRTCRGFHRNGAHRVSRPTSTLEFGVNAQRTWPGIGHRALTTVGEDIFQRINGVTFPGFPRRVGCGRGHHGRPICFWRQLVKTPADKVGGGLMI